MKRATAIGGAFLLMVAGCSRGDPDGLPSDGNADGTVAETPIDTKVDPGAMASDPFGEAVAESLGSGDVLPLAAAVDLAASVFGEFPEGDPSAFPEGDPHAPTLALMAVAGHYEDLTPGQQAALAALVEGPEGDYGEQGVVLSAGAVIAIPARMEISAQPEAGEYVALVDTARDEIARRVGRPVGLAVRVVTFEGDDSTAFASPLRDGHFVVDGRADECLVELWPERLAAGGDLFVRSVITHEVYHCFQYSSYDDLARHLETAPWIVEGQAYWVAAEIAGGTQAWSSEAYTDWLCRPGISLYKRLRPSMGFYAALATHGGHDIWPLLDDMLGLSRVAAIEALGLPATDALRITATSRMNDSGHSFGGDWYLNGAGIPGSACRSSGSASIDTPWEWSGDLQPFAASAPYIVSVSGDVVRVDALSEAGAVEFSDGTEVRWAEAATELLCLRDGGCECPDGRTVADRSAAPGETAVAIGSWSGHGAVSLLPFSLEDACLLPAELPRMSLRGSPTVELEGGYCYIDEAGFLIIAIGYLADWDAILQEEPLPHYRALLFHRAVPGTRDTGSIYFHPTGGEIIYPFEGAIGPYWMTLRKDFLVGTFSWSHGSGSFSCPRLWSLEELAAGYSAGS